MDSIWIENAVRPAFHTMPGSLKTDVLIIGGGMAGLLCAHMLKKAGMLITDYSSICFDFAYMKKPLLYYQFDYDKFRKGQYQEGYFSYKEDGFGRVCVNSADLVDEFCRGVELDMEMQEEYLNRVNGFFKFFDNNNCHRVYCKIMEKLKGKE